MTKWTSIAWRKENDWIDFYQTPTWCIDKLLEHETFEGRILEPCSWAWAISKVLEWAWYDVLSCDIREDSEVYWRMGIDFLDIDIDFNARNVVTNPPYCNAKQFIEKSLQVAEGKVCMFLKLQFLESIDRYEFFKNTPLKKVLVFCKRPTLYPSNGPVPENKGTIAYAWYIWEKGYEGKPEIDWIK